jgi:hypothetical protein
MDVGREIVGALPRPAEMQRIERRRGASTAPREERVGESFARKQG